MVEFTQPPAANYEDDDSQPWKPKKDSPQSVIGTVLERKSVSREDGTDVEFVKIEAKDGQAWLVWCSPTQLKACLATDDPQPGDTWGVEYQGSKSIGQGRSLDLYGSYHKAAKVAAKAPKGYKVASGADAHFEANDDEPF